MQVGIIEESLFGDGPSEETPTEYWFDLPSGGEFQNVFGNWDVEELVIDFEDTDGIDNITLKSDYTYTIKMRCDDCSNQYLKEIHTKYSARKSARF